MKTEKITKKAIMQVRHALGNHLTKAQLKELEQIISDLTIEVAKDMAKQVPMQRLGRPEEVAALVDFLFSEGAGYITGQAISVNGGML